MTLSIARVIRGALIAAMGTALGVAALFLIVRSQMPPADFGCARYLDMAASEDFRESLYNWARREFQNVSFQPPALPKGYGLSTSYGEVEALDASGLDFFPERHLQVGLDIDSSGLVERVYVGRAPSRAGLIVFLRGESEHFHPMPTIVERYESLAVYCNGDDQREA